MRIPKNKPQPVPAPPRPEECLAKTFTAQDGTVLPGRTIREHGIITGLIATSLIALFSGAGQKLFDSRAPALAGMHDNGKATPPFQCRLLMACNSAPDRVAVLLHYLQAHRSQDLADIEKNFGKHAGIGFQSFLKLYPEDIEAARTLARHHGDAPPLHTFEPEEKDITGGPSWEEVRETLIKQLGVFFGFEEGPSLSQVQSILWSGLISVSDWIASSPVFDDPGKDYHPLLSLAMQQNGFSRPDICKGRDFGSLFHDAKLRPLIPNRMQSALSAAIHRGGVYIVQAPMGLGKTEAALFAAYQLLQKDEARGIYAALPTRLTATQFHGRMQDFLNHALSPDSALKQAFLIHGGAKSVLTEAGADAAPGGSFFSGTRRQMLAPFAAGTIDQALLSILNVKYYTVRFFGLADKVIILDEVHSYDVYVSTLLCTLIERLREAGATVIILSATLTSGNIRSLLKCDLPSTPYPANTCMDENTPYCVPITDVPESACRIQLSHAEDQSLEEAMRRALSGEQVLWTENTVADAQRIYHAFEHLLADKPPKVKLGLLHSRFTAGDRRRHETLWLQRLGKTGFDERVKSGAILVGTQVLEQSIDIDADCLFTRLCPVDFILQRIGRTWRFASTPRPACCERSCTVIAPALKDIEERDYWAFEGSAYVYEPYTLLRTLEALEPRSGTVLRLPYAIQELLDAVYTTRKEEGKAAKFKKMLSKGCRKLHHAGSKRLTFIAQNQIASDQDVGNETIFTRYFTRPTLSLLLLQSPPVFTDGKRVTLHLYDGSTLHLDSGCSRQTLHEATLKLEENLVEVLSAEDLEAHQLTAEMRKRLKPTLLKLLPRFLNGGLILAVSDQEQLRFTDSDGLCPCLHYSYTRRTGFEQLKELK